MNAKIKALLSLINSLRGMSIEEEEKDVLAALRSLLSKLGSKDGQEALQALKKMLRGKTKSFSVLEWFINSGRYDGVDLRITSDIFPNLPKDHLPGTNLKQFCFNDGTGYGIYLKDAIEMIRGEGSCPGTLWDTLSFGINNTEVQRKRVVVGPGTVVHVNGEAMVLCLGGNWHERTLFLAEKNTFFVPDTIFLGFSRKPPKFCFSR